MEREVRLKRLYFRSWHRGTREADNMIGGFFDKWSLTWTDEEIDWFEMLLEEEDVDIMAWAIGKQPPPARFQTEQMTSMQKLDYFDFTK
ncbi:succinate dehydrogenase assembly factor 2 [Parasphingorhabdus sp.]|uniref:FAD assembly factor SdhE n=1 Tax=Parasphingorhabdus sp. TaxID=2709688 RepID=UPI002F92BC89